MGLLWEYTHSYGDVQRAERFKREERIGVLKVENLKLNILLPLKTHQNENERKEKSQWAYIMGPSENELYC